MFSANHKYQIQRAQFTPTLPHPAIFRAVDFDHTIIHAEAFTWDEWCDQGKRFYPSCEPVRDEYLNDHPGEFDQFLDMRG